MTCSSRVSFESRKGICDRSDFDNAETQLPVALLCISSTEDRGDRGSSSRIMGVIYDVIWCILYGVNSVIWCHRSSRIVGVIYGVIRFNMV